MQAITDGFTRHRRAVIATSIVTVLLIVTVVALATAGGSDVPTTDAAALEAPSTTATSNQSSTTAASSIIDATSIPSPSTTLDTASTTSVVGSSTTTTTTFAGDRLPTLVEGATGDEVAALQRMLNIVTGSRIAVDGTYGPATTEAVSNFQKIMELPVTGEADHDTRLILFYMDGGRSNTLPEWPIPSIGNGGADGCQVTVIGDSLMAGAMRQQERRLGELGCASAADAVGGRSLAIGWQCRVNQPNGSRPLLLIPEPEPGNDTCAPSGLTLLRLWADARALGDLVVIALGTNDAGLYTEQRWIDHWEEALALTGDRPVVFLTTGARLASPQTAKQEAYSDALRRFCTTQPRCVVAEWAYTATALDSASYIDAVHLTAIATEARSAFIRDVVGALIDGRPIPNPRPIPTPVATLPTTTTSTTTTTIPATTTTRPATTTTTPTTTTRPPTTTTAPTTTTPTTTTPTTTTPTTTTSTTTSTSTTIAGG